MRSFLRDLRGELPWLAPIGAMTVLTFILAICAGRAHQTDPLSVIWLYGERIVLITPVVALAAFTALTMICALRREASPVATIVGMVRTRFASPAAWASVAAALGMIPVLMGSFGLLKMLLPLSMPFTWDGRLAAIDRALFLGTDPWRVTHALFGSPFATQLLDIAYALWVPLVIIGVLVACCAEPYARARYLLSFAASWLCIGVLGAYCLSSAGPCFTGLLGTAEAAAYAPLMDRLHDLHAAIGLGAVDWQQELWVAYHGTEYGFAKGISAMPSMHNAIAFLYVLALANGPRFLRVGSWVFAAAIFVGSIHLGWHYAADGIVAGLMMWGIWAAAGFYLDRVGYGRTEIDAAPELPGFAPEPVAI